MDGAIGPFLCGMLFILPLALLIGAAILRGGVHFANKCLPREVERDYEDEDDWDDYDRPRRRRGGARPIPEPGLGKAMGIVFVRMIVGFVISIPINLALGLGVVGAARAGGDPELAPRILASLIQLPIGFLINAGLLVPMLPTTFPRACLVVVFEFIIALAIGLIIAVPLVVLLFAAAR